MTPEAQHPVSVQAIWPKILFSIFSALTAAVYLLAYPYYPVWVIVVLALFLAVYGFFNAVGAVLLGVMFFTISLAYHSFALAALFLIVFAFFALYTWSQQILPLAVLLAAAMPLLAAVKFPGTEVSLDFLILLLSAVFFSKSRALIVSAGAFLWSIFYAIVTHHLLAGNIAVGVSSYDFYALRTADNIFYNLSWIADKAANFPVKNLLLAVETIVTHIVSHRGILVALLCWPLAAFCSAFSLEWNKVWQRLLGVFVAVLLIVIGHTSSFSMDISPRLILPEHFFSIVVIVTVLCFILYQIYEIVIGKYSHTPLGVSGVKPVRKNDGSVQLHVPQSAVEITRKSVKIDDFIKGRPSLEDTLKVQHEINEYMKKRFVHDATALALDIVGSTALKNGEDQEAIIVSFTEYWRFVDGAVWKRSGRLLNRAGDGAIYVFKYPEQAVQAAREILAALNRFNRKGNLLKNPFQVRMGMDIGKIIEQSSVSGGGDVFSQVIDIAAHLEALAPINGLLISQTAYDKLSRFKNDFFHQGRSERDNVETYQMKS